jgi:hypothetical protein
MFIHSKSSVAAKIKQYILETYSGRELEVAVHLDFEKAYCSYIDPYAESDEEAECSSVIIKSSVVIEDIVDEIAKELAQDALLRFRTHLHSQSIDTLLRLANGNDLNVAFLIINELIDDEDEDIEILDPRD